MKMKVLWRTENGNDCNEFLLLNNRLFLPICVRLVPLFMDATGQCAVDNDVFFFFGELK
jgi:hypothetical protein